MAHDNVTTEELLARAEVAIRRGHENLENFARRVEADERRRQGIRFSVPALADPRLQAKPFTKRTLKDRSFDSDISLLF